MQSACRSDAKLAAVKHKQAGTKWTATEEMKGGRMTEKDMKIQTRRINVLECKAVPVTRVAHLEMPCNSLGTDWPLTALYIDFKVPKLGSPCVATACNYAHM